VRNQNKKMNGDIRDKEPLGRTMEQIQAVRAAEFPGLARLEGAAKSKPIKAPTFKFCTTCSFWTERPGDYGWCHRFPQFERKDPDQWCGEWEKEN
jgi:hypothetical protein